MGLSQAAIEFRQALEQRLKAGQTANIRSVVCKSVDWDAMTMIGTGGDDDLEFLDISLGFGSVNIKPVVGSDCLIALIDGEDSVCWLLHASEVELIQFNGGDLGGVVKIQELTKKLNGMADKVNSLINSFNQHTHKVVTTGTAAAQKGTASPTTMQAQKTASFKEDDYEDTKITH